ncbi:putative RNA helicase [Nitrococcus mobilis Nb-231]|uniref:Putative RNA helicase n=1 Tax=Nitrococcus mobilis Nb-231 TaxID=314278 RepID=A4BL29_9GAMM|nr:hypothetical protein [Nitrococcus mobilis]EAR23017.1 putative RNA helicase [Nitrococcus mobilis Nb-231]
MLDFLLIRPKDQLLWRCNVPGTLRYLVVDELHTFDGAQGTDLACLIRRLRDRLEGGPELACVGTSATLGSDSMDALVGYASEVFTTVFDEASVIGEDRLSPEEYLLGRTQTERAVRREAIRFFGWPERHEQRLDPSRYERPRIICFTRPGSGCMTYLAKRFRPSMPPTSASGRRPLSAWASCCTSTRPSMSWSEPPAS